MPKSIVPLRYPGGKSKVVKNILDPLFPEFKGDFYDPFIGGGSIVTWMAQKYPDKKIFANDLNPALYIFWVTLQYYVERMVDKLLIIRYENDPDDIEAGRALLKEHQRRLYDENISGFDRAVSYYVLNKISFSGMTEHGSISKDAYAKTFNPINIKKLYAVSNELFNVEFSNIDYETAISLAGEGDFIFLDPPYDLGKKSNLYGKNGEMHDSFDHERFAEVVKGKSCKWMITYNDSEEIRERFKDYNIVDREYTYYMAFGEDELGNKVARKKNELVIMNY